MTVIIGGPDDICFAQRLRHALSGIMSKGTARPIDRRLPNSRNRLGMICQPFDSGKKCVCRNFPEPHAKTLERRQKGAAKSRNLRRLSVSSQQDPSGIQTSQHHFRLMRRVPENTIQRHLVGVLAQSFPQDAGRFNRQFDRHFALAGIVANVRVMKDFALPLSAVFLLVSYTRIESSHASRSGISVDGGVFTW